MAKASVLNKYFALFKPFGFPKGFFNEKDILYHYNPNLLTAEKIARADALVILELTPTP